MPLPLDMNEGHYTIYTEIESNWFLRMDSYLWHLMAFWYGGLTSCLIDVLTFVNDQPESVHLLPVPVNNKSNVC